jgi:hypothetical protein
MEGDKAKESDETLTNGIQPEWWARAIRRGWISANEPFAFYYSGDIDIRSVSGLRIFDFEPGDGVRLLAVTTESLVGVVVRRAGNGANVSLSFSRSAIGFGEVLSIRSAWSSWIDLRDPDDVDFSPQFGLSVDIELRSSLEGFGTEIHLPLDQSDYRGEHTPAVHRFVDRLERRLSGAE